jgi:ketopantoate reductase
MESPVILIGIGEMGGVFARGLLRAAHPVYPANRGSNLAAMARQMPAPELVLVAVTENELPGVLENLPTAWLQRIGLLQNELLPADWQQYGITNPTVISVWFEKKTGQDVRILLPSPVYGKAAAVLHHSLQTLGIPTRLLASESELLFELVLKNVYIVTTNCAGLATGGTVSELWARHRELAEGVAREVIGIQESLVGQSLPADELIEGMLSAFAGDPHHRCMGRSAISRLARALQQADDAGLEIPRLRQIAAGQQQTG